jgi:hypothetical protein
MTFVRGPVWHHQFFASHQTADSHRSADATPVHDIFIVARAT